MAKPTNMWRRDGAEATLRARRSRSELGRRLHAGPHHALTQHVCAPRRRRRGARVARAVLRRWCASRKRCRDHEERNRLGARTAAVGAMRRCSQEEGARMRKVPILGGATRCYQVLPESQAGGDAKVLQVGS